MKPQDYESLEDYMQAHRKRTRQRQAEAKQGEKSRTARLTEAQVKEIRARYVPGKYGTGAKAQVRYLEEKYGIKVHWRTIESILTRDSWKHI